MINMSDDNTNERLPQSRQEEEKKDNEATAKNPTQTSQIIAQRWRDFLGNANINDLFLTKEDYELVRSVFNISEATIEYNILEYLKGRSTDPCAIQKLLNFIVVRKIGNILLQSHQTKLEALKFMLDKQTSIYQSLVNAISSIASLIPQISFNPISDLKWDAILAILIAALTATSIEIGNIKNNIRELVSVNEFCIRGCGNCDQSQLITKFKDLIDNTKLYNEGIEFAKESNDIVNIIESIAKIEMNDFNKETVRKHMRRKGYKDIKSSDSNE